MKRGEEICGTLALLDHPWPLCTARSYIAFHVTVFLRSFNSTHAVVPPAQLELADSVNQHPQISGKKSLLRVGRLTTRSVKTCHAGTLSSVVRSKIIWKVLIESKPHQQLQQWFHQNQPQRNKWIYQHKFWWVLKWDHLESPQYQIKEWHIVMCCIKNPYLHSLSGNGL